EELNRGGIGLLLFRPDYYNIYIGLPNKLFDYMLLGLPIIATDLPEIGRIIREADCGILVDPADAAGIAEAIAYLAERPDEAVRMGANGRRAVEERYNWGRMEGVLLDVYRILERSGN
ncbi:MAG: glycosyltransferase, partial [Methanomicrobiaceae archaeon]|nr:glycosyltransferase [Methanomicrobiaceae archaeon]